ncbi:helix-hairpin-helix domain-containing protein [Halomonas sp. HP20-15]|uniref:ComEA family DNA-binding protein n=1 Tax=Halomonas sp. HP20-15 TaxID=3085901 RepID=UPI002980B578|nr:helix-hairpin-helix domain-containing protein [Halomonas sp. HP20-15]MDW5376408.1 helix-hairpin-helix domain-containing protein [Halomonas sp. HP20-15]
MPISLAHPREPLDDEVKISTARDFVSEHAPLYLTTGDATPAFGKTNDPVTVINLSDRDDRHCIDSNTTPASELDRLPNVGPARAQEIIDGRSWQSVEELTRIRGIGKGRMTNIRSSGLLCGA